MALPLAPGGDLVTDLDRLRDLVGEVCDPELPPLTLADLGILRSVERRDDTVVVTVTPTYSGCPAVEVIEDEIRAVLDAAGCVDAEIERSLTPAWSSDWITDEGRWKLSASGIAPPQPVASGPVPVAIGRKQGRGVACPRCGSVDTVEVSPFGSTACKALHRCNTCAEPFDYFKDF